MEPDPQLFVDAVFAYLQTAAVKAAVDLDLFSAIGRGAGAPAEIARETGAAERGVRILCDYLTVRGFLEKEGARYRMTPSTAAFLDRTSPAWMGSVVDFLAAPEMLDLHLKDPAGYVRNGGSAGLANIAPDNPLWVTFARAMVPFVTPISEALAAEAARWSPPPCRVLDIAAGHGVFGISIAKVLPEVEVTAVDWRAVLEVAGENAPRAGVAERYRTRPGSAFEVDWGEGYDLVLLTNFLHHFDPDACVGLLRKARGSLAPAGRAAAVEFVPNEDRITPPFPAMFSFVMLGSTPRGEAHTACDYDAMGRAAGFSRISVQPLRPSPQSLVLFEV